MARTKIDGEGQIAEETITGGQIKDESVTGSDITDGSITRQDLNTTSTGRAVVRKVLAGDGIEISYDGADVGTGDVTINLSTSTGGITSAQHREILQLVHEVAKTSYYEIVRSGSGKITNEIWWQTSVKLKKIKEISYTYIANRVSSITTQLYDINGNAIIGEQLTETFTYSGQQIENSSIVLT